MEPTVPSLLVVAKFSSLLVTGKFSSLAPVVRNSGPSSVIDSKTSKERAVIAHLVLHPATAVSYEKLAA